MLAYRSDRISHKEFPVFTDFYVTCSLLVPDWLHLFCFICPQPRPGWGVGALLFANKNQ